MPFYSKTLIAIALSTITNVAIAKTDALFDNPSDFFIHQKTYIIQLNEAPLTTYNGDLNIYKATNIENNNFIQENSLKLNIRSKASRAYSNFLKQRQEDVLNRASDRIRRKLDPKFSYHAVLNGFAIKLTPIEAEKLKMLDGIKSILVAQEHHSHTDRGPLLINAPSSWDGTSTGVSAMGEGIVVAIIDTGIRHDHPSFAEIDPVDGYTHINPLGNGVYKGYCETNTDFCNNKLIGAYNFADGVTDPEDENQHGTHVASTAAGNHISFDLGNGNAMELSGVAPRANIISYRISDSEGLSTGGASTAAIEQAVVDGVDVINYSFGGGAFNPWAASSSIAYRNARAAGVIVITSAGNDGPNPETIGSPADAPWITTVAASTHDRGAFPSKSLSNMTGGSSTPPTTISGQSLTGEITASIVYAGNYSNGDSNPEQCLTPFPEGTFNGEIVVCDRGEIARVQKARNVAAGGAGGYVLANIQGGSTFLADDIYVIPGIHIIADDGDTLKTWLATGANHIATVEGTSGSVGVDADAADIVAGFSARGPNPTANGVIKPSVAAPGVSIFAAGIGEVDYTFLQGTSMASPHVAGAAALIKQQRPTWTAGQVHTALMSTAVTSLTKEDGTTPADAFDIGGGRVDINTALNAGLLMDETPSNFIAANPAEGGDPRTLNLPAMTDAQCSVSCSWTRTISAAVAGTWNVSFITDSGLTLTVEPSSFTLSQAQTQSLVITADIVGTNDDWLFGEVIVTPNDNATSTTHFPVAIQVNNSNLPTELTIDTQRNSGQYVLEDISSIATSSLEASTFMTLATPVNRTLATDSDNESPFDDLADGVSYELISVQTGSQLLFAQTSNSSADDLDLYVGIDSNGDGQPQESETLKRSISEDANEQILLTHPEPGNYWVLVQNWSGATSGTDNYLSTSGVVGSTENANVNLSLPSTSNGSDTFDIEMNFSNIDIIDGKYFGVLALGTGTTIGNLGASAFVLSRVSNDITINAPSSATVGDDISITITASPSSNEQREYTTRTEIPSGLNVNASSLTNGATINGTLVSWDIAVTGSEQSFTFSANVSQALAGQTVELTVEHDVDLNNAQSESISTSVSVQSASTGGTNTGGSSSGGGSFAWLLLTLPVLIRSKK